ncbi:MAG: acyl-CoA carboxylase subunit beta [Methylovirgula sp.]
MNEPRAEARQSLEERVATQHASGKLAASERIALLLDPGSFEEYDGFVQQSGSDDDSHAPATNDGVVTGSGTVNGRAVLLFAKDMTVLGGALSAVHAQKIVRLQDMALRMRAPLIGLFDSQGIRIQDGAAALAGLGDILQRYVRASGVIPQLSLIMGPCIGGDAFAPALSDFTFMVRDTSSLFVTGPEVIKAVTNESIGIEELGGASVHAVKSAVADGAYDNDVEALRQMRRLLDFLPSSNEDPSPEWPSFDDPERREMALDSLVPDDPGRPYDIKELIDKTVDEGDFFEIQEAYAKNIVIGFGRIEGRSVGLVANQPLVLAGVLDGDAARKAARFVRFCDCFNLPIVTFVDAPGFLPGIAQEHAGLVKQGAKLLFAYAEASVPKITIITRNALGVAYDVMASKHLRGDMNYAWPSAQIGLIGAQGAVEMLFPSEKDDPDKFVAYQQDYEARVLSPIIAAEHGLIDDIIMPHDTRARIARALALLRHKHLDNPSKKHDNIPL